MMAGSYDYRLVTLWLVIAICASCLALDLARRVAAARGRARVILLIGGAAAMGWASGDALHRNAGFQHNDGHDHDPRACDSVVRR